MSSRTEIFLHSRTAFRAFIAAATLAVLVATASEGRTASPFELEIGELDRQAGTSAVKQGKPASKARKARRRTPVDPGPPAARDLEGEFVSYTIRPGDHIFKVLTARFGLSSARAEELIPRILRVNRVRDVRGLQVGRTIRIPLPGKPAGSKAQAPPSAAAIPPPDEGTEPAPAQPPSNGQETHSAEPAAVSATKPVTAEDAGPAAALHSPPPAEPRVGIRAIPPGDPRLVADAILEALSLKWSRSHPVTIPLGKSGGASLTVPVDRYFETGGKKFFLDFGDGDADRATLLRLVELAGYRRIPIQPKGDFRVIADAILAALNLRADYRKHLVSPASSPSGGKEVSGYLVARPDGTGDGLLMIDGPLDKPLADLAGSGGLAVR